MSLVFLLVSILFATAFAVSRPRRIPSPSPLPQGEDCFIGGFLPPTECEEGLTCVIDDFGNIPVDLPATGVCTLIESSPPACSVEICSATGADTICGIDSFVATCGAWATRKDGGTLPVCPEICTLECLEPKLVASDGQEFCNVCLLQGASCDSNFEIFGPVKKDPCKPPISLFDQLQCCTAKGIGCISLGERCSTLGSFFPTVPCEEGLTCVIDDFGFPAADRPNSGTCREIDVLKECTVPLCASKGADFVCEVPLPVNSGIVSTCKAWATRSDGNPKPECNLSCPEFCLINMKPVASNGQKFCSICALFESSCKADFMFFGPVLRRH
eukprot:gb/GEZJ01000743.1/.p1 GENE.gb/GEZJ01000743.1/~~gb/GEZJ01000743.1/.p1  ORF type:complete len:329 (+),score=24.83 gb/GEZJ01000743.1/:173-1159(+)